ncbi:2772_t:CDS:2 [Ambispora gerdemannii]|uniref:2772_t:CDS:1 n=1 Tax=Ambispora gerdemannii TaxID=144530 RepID=A0A9N8VQN6_9GLOM|nr:2772_t:CDS:2 [Ambispora gerdemannii]
MERTVEDVLNKTSFVETLGNNMLPFMNTFENYNFLGFTIPIGQRDESVRGILFSENSSDLVIPRECFVPSSVNGYCVTVPPASFEIQEAIIFVAPNTNNLLVQRSEELALSRQFQQGEKEIGVPVNQQLQPVERKIPAPDQQKNQEEIFAMCDQQREIIIATPTITLENLEARCEELQILNDLYRQNLEKARREFFHLQSQITCSCGARDFINKINPISTKSPLVTHEPTNSMRTNATKTPRGRKRKTS